jgi:hypothetical protein
MEPVIIFSFLGNRIGSNATDEDTKIFATCSQYYAKKNTGLKTVLYTDKIGAELLKNIPYDEIILLDDKITNKLPRSVWSAGKILTMSMEKRPFIHIDFDFFILNNSFLEKIKNAPFFTYHDEPWSSNFGKGCDFYKNGVAVILDVLNKSLNLDLDQKFMSVNFAIFGSCIENNIPIINETAQKMIDCIIEHKDFLDGDELITKFKTTFDELAYATIPVIIEQVLFLIMMKKKLKTYTTLIPIKYSQFSYSYGLKVGVLHLWDGKKVKEIRKNTYALYKKICKEYRIK